MRRSRYSDILRIALGMTMICVLWACSDSSDNSASNNTGNELVWDKGNWNESNWQ